MLLLRNVIKPCFHREWPVFYLGQMENYWFSVAILKCTEVVGRGFVGIVMGRLCVSDQLDTTTCAGPDVDRQIFS